MFDQKHNLFIINILKPNKFGITERSKFILLEFFANYFL